MKPISKAVSRLNTLPSIARLALFIIVISLIVMFGSALAVECFNDITGTGALTYWSLDNADLSAGVFADKCIGRENMTGTVLNALTGQTGKWNEAVYCDGNDDAIYNTTGTEGQFNATQSFAYNIWVNTSTNFLDYRFILMEMCDSCPDGHSIIYVDSSEHIISEVLDNEFDYAQYIDATSINDASWSMLTLNYYGNDTVCLFINATLKGCATTAALDSNFYAVGTRFSACAVYGLGGGGIWIGEYTGLVDEISVFNYTLSASTLNNLYTYNTLTAPGTGNIGCDITLNNYPDGYHTNDANPNLNYSITCYDSMPTSCQANTNDSTVFSLFSTPPINGSSKILTLYETLLQPLVDGSYAWNVSCTNTTITNFSENRSFILDTINPILTFTNPANNSQYAYNTTLNNLTVVCKDLNVYNLSVAIVNDSGQQSIFTNSTPSGGNLTLTDTFTSGLSQGAYWAVANCSDSHTKKKWKADQIINETLQIKIRKGDAWVILDWDNSSTSNYSELEDRVKWGFWAQVNNNSKINEVLRVKCDEPLYLVNASIAHFVCGSYWIDFADLAESGYTFEINQVNDYKYKVRIKKNSAGNPGDWIYTDPSVGGLNWITETHNFTISYAPTVTLTYPVNLTLACFAEPCLTTFQFTPASFITLTSSQLYGNFSGAWAANATNQTALANGTTNTITVNLSRGFYAWNVRVNDSINASYAAVNLTLGLVAPTLVACNGTAGAASINFTFYNEENISVPIYANMSAVLWVLSPDRTYNLTVNGSWTNTTNVTLCVYPANVSVVLDSFQEYNGSFAGFSKREYFLRNASLPAGLVVTVPLYALPYSLSSLLSVTVVSQILPVENAYITFERYYSDLNQFIGVGMAKTNEDGLGSAYIQPNSIYYRMVIEKDFTVLKTTTSTKFAASTITVDVSESGQSEYFRYSNGVAFNCTFNDTTDLIVCQVIDTSGLVPAVRFTAYEQSPFSTSPVCYNRTTSTASVVFFCDISNITNPVVYSLVAEAPESDIWLWGGTVQSGATAAVFGDVGLFASVGVIAGIAFLGLITPPMLIVMGAFGLVVTVAMGLMNLSLAGVIAVGFLAALLLARMRE